MAARFGLNYALVARNNLLRPACRYVFLKDDARTLVSKNIESHIKRQTVPYEASSEIKLVDGSKLCLVAKSPTRLKAQDKAIAKVELQTQIRSSRFSERLFTLILNIMTRKYYGYSVLRSPIWRITRVTPIYDRRSYIIHWIIDEMNECIRYKNSIEQSFKQIEPLLRYDIGKELKLKFIPSLSFRYESFSAEDDFSDRLVASNEENNIENEKEHRLPNYQVSDEIQESSVQKLRTSPSTR